MSLGYGSWPLRAWVTHVEVEHLYPVRVYGVPPMGSCTCKDGVHGRLIPAELFYEQQRAIDTEGE